MSAPAASDKYDRQLRLWGDEGQAKLEKANVCLINGNALGTETLKNLVLPGIGSFTVVDGKKVEAADLGSNFFLESSNIGQSRALCCTEFLRELNDRVRGSSVEEDPVDLINSKIEFFESFSVVIASGLPEAPLRKLALYLYENSIPLVVTRAYGFIGYLRVVTPEHTIVESKPDNPPDDLRIHTPFTELQKYVDKFDITKVDEHEHGHIPYLVILVKALDQWKQAHAGAVPNTRAEKEEFKKSVSGLALNIQNETNFQEAVKAAMKAWTPTTIPDDVKAILSDEKAADSDTKPTDFWILASALNKFVANEGNGMLPLSGTIPDMTADTTGYVSLQRLYHEKAAADVNAVANHVDAIQTKLGRNSSISPDAIKKFCKNARFLKIVRYRSLEQEYTEAPSSSGFTSKLEDPESCFVFYVMLRAVDRFYSTNSRYPGFFDDKMEMETDISTLRTSVNALLAEWGISPSAAKDEPIHEMCRFGASEMHNICSLMGGIASQEAIKLITHQYIPLNNTLIFNGINGTSLPLTL